ncbi:MAG: CinA family nicotinamide mononucleotide deamidase-related protein [Dehalococcoidales bacterium]|nr:MAG: CinA family nicotinamide mononucleotide deamidase-related protein [Dehalococcoidales bacterium]
MKAEIISIGTEILLGEITDTNATYIASRLPFLGIDLYWISQVGDNKARIIEILQRAWNRSDIIFITGGLGPTADDVTRESIAEMLGEEMNIDPDLEKALRNRFGRYGFDMPLSNLKQATIIPSAQSIPNPAGTAPGWWVEKDGHTLVTMPGPPRELNVVWQETVQPRLEERAESVLVTRTFKTFGYSEGGAGEMVADMLTASNPTLGIYAKYDGIHLRLAAKAESVEKAEKMLVQSETRIREIMAGHIWGMDNDTLETIVGSLLIEKGSTLAVMEDSHGGSLTPALNDIPGSERFFKGGLLAGNTSAMTAFGVSPDIANNETGEELACAMAESARNILEADIGIGTTGTDEVTRDNPMGTTYIGIADVLGSRAVSRPRRRQYVTATILFELRESLLNRSG